MPATTSTCFANNKGGSGKTFLLFQTACDAAVACPERQILVVDFSLYSDTTALLLGGLSRPHALAASAGLTTAVNATTPDARAEGLVRDLAAAGSAGQAPAPRSIFGSWFRKAPAPADAPPLDLRSYALRPADHNARVPPNVWLIPGCGTDSWGAGAAAGAPAEDAMEIDGGPMWTKTGGEWKPAAAAFAAALAALPGEWSVFVDTDHLAASPLTKLALGACADVAVPLSLDEGDFSRLFIDVTGNSLFANVMMPMAGDGSLAARVRRFVFSQVQTNKNASTETAGGVKSPFTPAQVAAAQMDALADSLRQAVGASAELRATFPGTAEEVSAACARLQDFSARFCTAFRTVPDVARNLSKLHGAPLATMKHTDATLGASRPSADVLASLQAECRFLTRMLLGDDMKGGA